MSPVYNETDNDCMKTSATENEYNKLENSQPQIDAATVNAHKKLKKKIFN